MLLELCGFFVSVLVIFCTYVHWKQSYWKRRGVPYLEPTFLLGNSENPFARKTAPVLMLKTFYDRIKKKNLRYGGVYSFTEPQMIVTDPEIARCILTKDFQYFVDRGLFQNEEDDPLRANLLSLEGQRWKNLRAKLTPTFTSGKMKMMFETLVGCSRPFHEAVKKAAETSEVIDMKKMFAYFTIDAIGSCAFGVDCDSFSGKENEFLQYGTLALKGTTFTPLKIIFARAFPNLARKMHLKLTNPKVEDFFRNMTKATVQLRLESGNNRKDFMQLLVDMLQTKENPEGLTFNQVMAQSFLFFLAGYETSSTAASYCFYELSRNQDVQDKLRDEIREVLDKHDGKITYDSIQEMKFLSQVVDETLRLHPPAPIIIRRCNADYRIPESDAVIERGTSVIVPTLGLQRDPEYFPDPLKFDPERFDEGNKGKILPFTNMPFGDGPRNCIGLRFGLMQVKVGLVSVLKDFRFTLNEKTITPIKLDAKAFLLTSLGGIWVNVHSL